MPRDAVRTFLFMICFRTECELCDRRDCRDPPPAFTGVARTHGLPEEHRQQVLEQRDEELKGAEEQPGPGTGQHTK